MLVVVVCFHAWQKIPQNWPCSPCILVSGIRLKTTELLARIRKMAAFSFTSEQVLQQILAENSVFDEIVDEEDVKDRIRRGLDVMVETGQLDKEVFLSAAMRFLVPLYEQSTQQGRNMHDDEYSHAYARRMLASHQIQTSSVLKETAMQWLRAIRRRLGSKHSIRTPFQSEISRDMTSETFRALLRIAKAMNGFCKPYFSNSNNKKTAVISFTSIRLVKELLTLLSGLHNKEIMAYFKRTLVVGARKGNKVCLIVSDTKEFVFRYKLNQGKLSMCFHYGEWNVHGFPQHT